MLARWAAMALVLLDTGGVARAAPASRSAASRPAASAPASRASTRPAAPADDLADLQRAMEADRQAGDAARPKAATGFASVLQSLNPDLSLILDIALAGFSDEEPPVTGGHDPQASGFSLQALELAASASVDPYFRFNANLVFSPEGVEVEEVYATTLALPWNLQLRAGQLLTRFGRINATHLHSWVFSDQVLVLGKFFGGDGNRGLGAELSLLMPLPWHVELIATATNAAGEGTARSFLGGSDLGVKGPGDLQYTVAVKQFFALGDNWSLAWGLSGAFGPNATERGNRTEIYGTDLYLKYRPITHGSYTVVSLDAEWMFRRRQVARHRLGPDDVLGDHGFYAYLFWRFARRWGIAGRYEYVSGVEEDPLDPEWTSLRQRASGNITFWPTEFSRVRLQYDYDRPAWRDPVHALFLAMEIAVGAHGAHAF